MCKVASEGLSSSLPVPSEALVVVSFSAREIPGEFSWTLTPRGVRVDQYIANLKRPYKCMYNYIAFLMVS